MPDLSGTTIDRYHLIEKLGEGGMAVVYKAYDTRLECEVAVKIIRTENLPQSGVERAMKRFEREAKSVARLTHANIVKVTDYGEYEGNPYLVMEYLPGGTLKELIKQREQIPWQEAAQLLIPIAEALDYAHSQGVIHRDIKPSNILLTQSGQPMLTDFGVAKIIEEEGTQDLTGTSATVGTPEYMAPEQIVSKTVDHRADIYALGVVFYELITGRRPYEADTPMAVLVKHASEPLPRPGQYVKDLPEEVEHFLYKTLTKKPEDRYQDAGDMVAALRSLLTRTGERKVGMASSSKPVNEQQIKPIQETVLDSSKKPPSILWWILGGIGVVVLIGIGFLIARLGSGTPVREVPTLTPVFTLVPTDTLTPIFTPTNSQTPTDASTNTPEDTPTPEIITGKLIENANCRYGPGSEYTNIEVFNDKSTVNINGINSDKDWINVIITPKDFPGKKQVDNCWINIQSIQLDQESKLQQIDNKVELVKVWYAYSDCYTYSSPKYKYWYRTIYRITSEIRAKSLAQYALPKNLYDHCWWGYYSSGVDDLLYGVEVWNIVENTRNN